MKFQTSFTVKRACKQQLVKQNTLKYFGCGYSLLKHSIKKEKLTKMKSLHGDLLVGASGQYEGIQSLSDKIFTEDHFRSSVLSSFLLGGEWPLCATCQLSANGRSLSQVNGLSLATVSKRHTNVPWPCHNGCAGNLPSLMMPVWPRLKEVGSRNPKEAHSCSNPPLPISPHTSLSLSVHQRQRFFSSLVSETARVHNQSNAFCFLLNATFMTFLLSAIRNKNKVSVKPLFTE